MKSLYLIFLMLVITSFSFAQNSFKKNSIYLEAGGNGLFGSLDYERQLTKQPGIGIRLGVGFYTEDAFYLTVPIGVNYLFKITDRSFIDAGAGITLTRIDGKLFSDSKNLNGSHFVNFIPSAGYRKHTAKDLMWRISITPVANKYAFTPWLGVSIGKIF